jgi:predicted LPLAT superfamily acyltransferase/predicted hotdog family 3-hydroxylacyl-ACP dehydratase
MTSDWQSHQEYSTPLAVKTIRWIALHLGRPVARGFLYPITLYYLIFAKQQRRASWLYLTRVLKRKPRWLDVAKHIHCFAATILDRVYLITGQFDKLQITFPAINMPLQFSRAGMGCILLGSHVGSFEVLRSYAVKKCPLPIKILMHEGQTPIVMQALNALNPSIAETIIPLSDGENSLLKVKDAVEKGYAVGMLGDRVSGDAKEKTVTCQLLGAPVQIPVAPIIIAASLKVPLIVFFGLYLGGNRYEIHFELLAEQIKLSRHKRQQEIQEWAQKYITLLEQKILAKPYNWFNFYDYWRDQAHQQALSKPQFEHLLPHAGAMILIDKVDFWNSKQIVCRTLSHRQLLNPLRLNGQLSSLHLIEYGAQATAIHGGLLTGKAAPGFLAAIRGAHFNVDNLDDIPDELVITAIAELKIQNGAVYQIRITADGTDKALFEARTTVIHLHDD